MSAALHGDARDILLAQARQLRGAGQVVEALSALARLEREHARFSLLHQERAMCLILMGDGDGARAALRQALAINPTLPACWGMLEHISRQMGDEQGAQEAARQAALLASLPPAVVLANSLYTDGALAPAETVIRRHLQADPENVGALRLLGRICMDRGALDQAETALARALAHAPDYHAARLDYAMALLQQQKHQLARQQAERLLAHDPANRDYLKQYGAACIGLGDQAAVIATMDGLLAKPCATMREEAELRLWRANALKAMGRADEAVADYRGALAGEGQEGVAWFSLANLKTHRFTEADIAAMQAATAQTQISASDRIYLSFALGKAMEDRADYALSWQYYATGNALRRARATYRAEVVEAHAAAMARFFTPDFFTRRAGWGVAEAAPIFVMGLPRSGSTLIEQILASHGAVEGTQELGEISRYAAELCGADDACGLPRDLAALDRLTAAEAHALGQRFLADTAPYRRLGRPFFIDKMPENFWHIGLIQLILPRAILIDVRRAPMACCFSNFKQLFGIDHNMFSYDLVDLARHYRAYLAVMRHWAQVLPGRVLCVQHEDVIQDLEGSIRRMLAHAGLPFDPACLDFHQTRRAIRTPSAQQVRQPLDAATLDQWQHYAPWLGPLQEALGLALTTYRS